MASRVQVFQGFFNQFYAFIGELQNMFPEDPDFKVFDTALRLIQKTNPSLALKYYKTNVLDTAFSSKIAEKDEKFFTEYEYSEFHEEVGGADVIGKLKQYWSVLSPASQAMVWEYITSLDQIARYLVQSG
jgi:hypothetical protein